MTPPYKYTEEQWAHLIQMNKHYSLEEPPNKKLWKTSGSTGGAVGSSQGSSMGVNLRGQCMLRSCLYTIDLRHRLWSSPTLVSCLFMHSFCLKFLYV